MEEFIIDDEYTLKFEADSNAWNTYRSGKKLSKSIKNLFKFYSLNVYNIDALLRNYFYLSNPDDFNDPFDCNINLVEDIGELNKTEFVSRNKYSNIGVCSFSEIIDNHLMWAHYTNNYNGFALKFRGKNIDVKLRTEDINRHSLTRVIYPKKPRKIRQEFPFAYHYVLTTKFKEWEYEKEWRIITELNSNNRELEYFPESVEEIYIGHKIPDTNKSAYKLILEIQEIRFPKTPVYVVYPHPTELKLMFEKVWN